MPMESASSSPSPSWPACEDGGSTLSLDRSEDTRKSSYNSSTSSNSRRRPLATQRESDSYSSETFRLESASPAAVSAASTSFTAALAPHKRKSNDLSDLTIDKLNFRSLGFYGRETELSTLLAHVESLVHHSSSSSNNNNNSNTKNAQQQRRLVLISGASGVGKSKLVECLRTPVVKQHHGLFARGKFNQIMRYEPYSGIAEACTEMLGAILGEANRTKGNAIREEIAHSLGSERLLLLQVIPVLAEFAPDFGSSYADESYRSSSTTTGMMVSSSSNDSKNRMMFAFLRFLRIVTKYFHPLVLVLDDLQWADTASLDLLEVIMTDQLNPRLMVIGLYRSNEVHSTHIFNRYLSALETKSLDGNFLLDRLPEMGNLGFDAVLQIIQDLLSSDDSRTLGLAQVCLRKTHGNPFFLVIFLSMLRDRQLLQFNFGTFAWSWNDAELEASTQVSDNVVDLLTSKMEALSGVLLEILKLAAFLGSTLEVNTLEIVWRAFTDVSNKTDTGESAFQDALLKLYTEGLFSRVSGRPPKICWVHDKVQEAAVSLIPSSDRDKFSRRVGEIMMSELDENQLETVIFIVADLLNDTSIDDVVDSEGRIKLAQFNLDACQKAVRVSAFETATKYAEKGIEWLPANAWTEHYALTLQLYSIGAKAEGFVGNVPKMDQYCQAVLSQETKPIEDKFDVYHTLIDSLSNRSSIEEASRLLFDILGQFQCRFPKNGVLVGIGVLRNIVHIKATMKSRDISNLDPMEDSRRIELMRFLDKLSTCMYMLKDARLPLVVFRSLNWTIKYGKCDFSPPTFATTGMMLTGILDDIQGGSVYGRHAIALLSDSGTISTSSRTMLCVYSFLYPRTEHLRKLLKPLLHGYDVGLQTGDTESAMWCMYHWLIFHFHVGSSLQDLEPDVVLYVKQMEELKREPNMNLTKLFLQVIVNLLGRDNTDHPTRMFGKVVDKGDFERFVGDPFWIAGAKFYQGSLFTYFGEHVRQADMALELGHDHLSKAHVASSNVPVDTFLKGVSCFAAARQTGKTKYARLAQIFRSKIKKWLDMGNPNVRYYDSFLDAEAMAYKGKRFAAIKHYEVTILQAARGGYQHDAALASERLGEFYVSEMGDVEEGKYRLQQAMNYWKSWGAAAKVDGLVRKYPDFFVSTQPSEICTPVGRQEGW